MCHVIMMSNRNIAVEMHDLEQYHDGLFVCFPPCYCVFLPSMTTEMASRCSISLGGCFSSKATLIRRQHEKVCKAYRYAAVVVVGIVAVKVAPAAVVIAAAQQHICYSVILVVVVAAAVVVVTAVVLLVMAVVAVVVVVAAVVDR